MAFANPNGDSSETLQLKASEIRFDAERIQAFHNVWIQFPGGNAFAQELRYQNNHLLLKQGWWQGSEGKINFHEVAIDMSGHRTIAINARFQSQDGRFVIRGQELIWQDRLMASQATWTTCSCDNPPWLVKADKVEVDGDAIRLQKGWLYIRGCPIVPLPSKIPSQQTVTPKIASISGRPVFSLPMTTKNKKTEMIFEPGYQRGPRYVQRFRLHKQAHGHLGGGYDMLTRAWRGEYKWRQKYEVPKYTFVSDVQGWSDSQYNQDFQTELFPVPQGENRLWAQYGPLRLESDTFVGLAAPEHRPALLDMTWFGAKRGVWWHLNSRSSIQSTNPTVSNVSGGQVSLSKQFAWLYYRADAQSFFRTNGSKWQPLLGNRIAVPFWGDRGSLRAIGQLGGMSLNRQIGPYLNWQLLSPKRNLFSVEAFWVPTYWQINNRLEFGNSHLLSRITSETRLVDFHADGDWIRFKAGYWSRAHMDQIMVGVATPAKFVRHRFDTALYWDWKSIASGITWNWRHPCQCLATQVGALWRFDEEFPQVSAQLQFK